MSTPDTLNKTPTLTEGPVLPIVSQAPITLRTVSPSQLKEADSENGCLRYWFLKKVGKVRFEEKAWLSTGTNIHAPIETYLRDGTLPDETSEHYFKLLAAREYLPQPGKDLLVEFAAKFPTYDNGPTFSMKVDLADPRDPEILDIWDHKSTSDIHDKKKLQLTKVSLLSDPQMMAYAHWGYRTGTHEKVRVRHFYISSTHKGKCNPPVGTIVPREMSEEKWDGALHQIRRMQDLAENPPDWKEVPYRKHAKTCAKYGGCPFLVLCTSVDPWVGVQMASSEGTEASDFLSQLQALAAKGESAYDDVPSPTADEVAAEPTKQEQPTLAVEASDLLTALQAQKAAIDAVGARAFTTVATMDGTQLETSSYPPLLPPDAPSRMTPQPDEKSSKCNVKKMTKKQLEDRVLELELKVEELEAKLAL